MTRRQKRQGETAIEMSKHRLNQKSAGIERRRLNVHTPVFQRRGARRDGGGEQQQQCFVAYRRAVMVDRATAVLCTSGSGMFEHCCTGCEQSHEVVRVSPWSVRNLHLYKYAACCERRE